MGLRSHSQGIIGYTGNLGLRCRCLTRRRKSSGPPQPTSLPGRTVRSVAGRPHRRRQVWFRLTAAVLVPGLMLCLAEMTLRWVRYGYSTSFFVPVERDGKRWWVENDRFGWRFFPPSVARAPAPVVMSASKSPGTCRIFILGESAALGDPRPAFGFGRYLEVLLQERFPTTRFEVVNVAMTAINSHAVRRIARECARHQGDIWVVYMGNNEYYGPFGAGTIFGPQSPPMVLVHARLALLSTRLGQGLAALVGRLGPGASGATEWTGLQMFLGQELAPDDARRAAVHRNFAGNLESILRQGTAAGARVLLASVAVSLAECGPFASLHGNALSSAACELAIRFADRGVLWLDAAAAVAQADEPGVPGAASFHEHVHFTFGGNYRMARLIADRLVDQLPPEARQIDAGGWASREVCDQRLGLTAWNQAAVLEMIRGRLHSAPYTQQLRASRRLSRIEAELDATRAVIKEADPVATRALYQQSLRVRPRDHRLHENFAEFLEMTGDLHGALTQWRTARPVGRSPNRVHRLAPPAPRPRPGQSQSRFGSGQTTAVRRGRNAFPGGGAAGSRQPTRPSIA